MARTTDDIVVGADGSIYVGAVGATPPADISDPWDAGEWTELGYTNEDGLKFADGKTLVDILVWQLFYPARKIITARDFTTDFVLRQFDGPTVQFGFGGGAITDIGDGFRYTPPAPSFIDERALGCEWLDGDKVFRLVIPRGLVTSNVEGEVKRSAPTDLPITFGVIGSDTDEPWYFDTNDESFADLVGS